MADCDFFPTKKTSLIKTAIQGNDGQIIHQQPPPQKLAEEFLNLQLQLSPDWIHLINKSMNYWNWIVAAEEKGGGREEEERGGGRRRSMAVYCWCCWCCKCCSCIMPFTDGSTESSQENFPDFLIDPINFLTAFAPVIQHRSYGRFEYFRNK